MTACMQRVRASDHHGPDPSVAPTPPPFAQNGVSQNWKLCWSEGCFKAGTNYAIQDPPAPRLSGKADVNISSSTCGALPSLGSLGGDAFLAALSAKLNFLRDRVDNAACNIRDPDPMDTLVGGWRCAASKALGAARHFLSAAPGVVKNCGGQPVPHAALPVAPRSCCRPLPSMGVATPSPSAAASNCKTSSTGSTRLWRTRAAAPTSQRPRRHCRW